MSNFGGPNSQFEIDLRTRLKPLYSRMDRLEIKLQNLINESIRNANRSITYWNTVTREIDDIYLQMNKVFASWSETSIPWRYRRSISLLQSRIENSKAILNIAKRGIVDLLNSRISTQIMHSLYTSAIESFANASLLGRRNLYNLIRLTQQNLIKESLINLTVGTGFDLGDLRKAAKTIESQLWSRLMTQVENKQFVQAGRYHYTPRYYSELVARTKFHEAHSNAARTQCANYNTDLIQVSTHNTKTEVCQDFEGKIFSISGKDLRFPPLTWSPPYHPNCLHLEFPTFESAMVQQGSLDSFSAFSLGNIDRPPLPSGFIPLAKRIAV